MGTFTWPRTRFSHGSVVILLTTSKPDELEKTMDIPQPFISAIATVGIPVADQDRALGFYTETLGMESRIDVPLPQFGGRWITVAPRGSGTTLALIPAHEGVPAGVETGIRLASPDAAATQRYLRDRGVDVGEL